LLKERTAHSKSLKRVIRETGKKYLKQGILLGVRGGEREGKTGGGMDATDKLVKFSFGPGYVTKRRCTF